MRQPMKRLAGLVLLALTVTLITSACAHSTLLHSELGHILVVTDDAQVYVRSDARFTIFSALLPNNWGYQILVDGDQNGIWGEGPDPGGMSKKLRLDFGYTQRHHTMCSIYIYTAYANDPDRFYTTSPCGDRKTTATLDVTSRSEGGTLQTLKIPNEELRNKSRRVNFAIQIYDSTNRHLFGSPTVPFVLILPQ